MSFFHVLVQVTLKVADLFKRNVLKIVVDYGIDDYDLIFNSYRRVLSLLQYLNDTLALCKTFLCILIKILAELREALQLSELRIFELQSTGYLLHSLYLSVTADTGYRDTGVNRRSYT